MALSESIVNHVNFNGHQEAIENCSIRLPGAPLNLAGSSSNILTRAGKEPAAANCSEVSKGSLADHSAAIMNTLEAKAMVLLIDGKMQQILSQAMYIVKHIAAEMSEIEGKKALLNILDVLLTYLMEEHSSMFKQIQQEYSSENNYQVPVNMSDVLEPRLKAVSKMFVDVHGHWVELRLDLHSEKLSMLWSPPGSSRIIPTVPSPKEPTTPGESLIYDIEGTFWKPQHGEPDDHVLEPGFIAISKMFKDMAQALDHIHMDQYMMGVDVAAVIAIFQTNKSNLEVPLQFLKGAFGAGFGFSFIGYIFHRSHPRLSKLFANFGTGCTVVGFYSIIGSISSTSLIPIPAFFCILVLGALLLNIFKYN